MENDNLKGVKEKDFFTRGLIGTGNYLKKKSQVKGVRQVLTVTGGLIVIMIIFWIINPVFISGRNVPNLLRQIAPILIIGIGQSYVLITGNIDLSIGSVVGMSTMMIATFTVNGVNVWAACLLALVPCLLVGFINGQLVARFKLPPFIATLGTMTVARGIAQIVNGGQNTKSMGSSGSVVAFRNVFYFGDILTFYSTVWIAGGLFLIFYLILSKTRTGRHIYAVGSNIEAARLSGVNTISTVTKVYIISAFCAFMVGVITTATTLMGDMGAGVSFEMYAVAASVIGGVSTLGGQGILIGTVVGAILWGVLDNGLQFAGAPVAYQNIIIGVIVVTSVLLDIIVRKTGQRRKMGTNNENRTKFKWLRSKKSEK